jgi:protein-tyrosine-phosphatase
MILVLTECNMKIEKLIKSADTLVFTCSGNIIRSAFCDLMANHISINKNIKSIGTKYFNSELYYQTATKARELNISEELISYFKPTHISDFKFEETSKPLFLCMTRDHVNDVLKVYNNPTNVRLITEVICKSTEISDPYFEDNYEEVFEILINCLQKIKHLLVD